LLRLLGWLGAGGFFCFGALGLTIQHLERVPLPRQLSGISGMILGRYFNQGAGVTQFHPETFWELRPGAEVLGVQVNQDGFRGVWGAKTRDARFRILTLGDSYTLDPGNPEEVCWPRAMETGMRNSGFEAQVLNFGMPGYTAYQGLRLYETKAREWSPDLVLAAFGTRHEAEDGDYSRSDIEKATVTRGYAHRFRRFLERNGTMRFLSFALDPPKTPAQLTSQNGRKRPRLSPQEMESTLIELVNAVRRDGHAIALILPPRLELMEDLLKGITAYDDAIRRAAASTKTLLIDVHKALEARQQGIRGGGAKTLGNVVFYDAERLTSEGSIRYAIAVYTALMDAQLVPRAAGNTGAQLGPRAGSGPATQPANK